MINLLIRKHTHKHIPVCFWPLPFVLPLCWAECVVHRSCGQSWLRVTPVTHFLCIFIYFYGKRLTADPQLTCCHHSDLPPCVANRTESTGVLRALAVALDQVKSILICDIHILIQGFHVFFFFYNIDLIKKWIGGEGVVVGLKAFLWCSWHPIWIDFTSHVFPSYSGYDWAPEFLS